MTSPGVIYLHFSCGYLGLYDLANTLVDNLVDNLVESLLDRLVAIL